MANSSSQLNRVEPAKAPVAPTPPPVPTRPRMSSVGSDLVVISQPQGARAEAFRTLRTHILVQHVRLGRRALSVCAPNAGVGCSFVAANLAAGLAQVGLKTLLIDGDLRHPSLERFFPAPRPEPGLAQALTSHELSFGDCIQHEVIPHLSLMYAGSASERAHELLASERFTALIDFCLREFEATIIDAPPANQSSDASRIASLTGYSLIVAGRDSTLVSDVKTLASELTGDFAQVVGTVLNEAKAKRK